MLDELIRELAAKINIKQMTSEGVLTLSKRVELQWAQAAILNDIMELHHFDKIKMAQKSKDSQVKQTTSATGQ